MKFFIYGNSGGIDEVKKELANPKTKTFETIKQVCTTLVKQRDNAFDVEDLYIRYYGYDNRIEKDVYIIATCRHGKENYIKKYGCPQFISYMVTI